MSSAAAPLDAAVVARVRAAASTRTLDVSISQTNARSGDSFEADGVTLHTGF
jgi:hypothetical protein